MLETVERDRPVRRAISARLATPSARSVSTTRSLLSSRSEPSEPDSSLRIAGDSRLRPEGLSRARQKDEPKSGTKSDSRTNEPLRSVPEALGLGEALKLLQGAVLDLADALAGDAEGAAHLLEGPGLVALEPVAHLAHLALAGR